MAVRRVFCESRQTECCGTPFSVGDEASRPVRPEDPEDVLGEGCDEEEYGGMLPAEWHDDGWPGTAGRVRAILLVHRMDEETGPGSRTFGPVPGQASPEPVDSCPRWFGRGEPSAGPGPRRERVATGVLVAPDTPGAAPFEPRDRL